MHHKYSPEALTLEIDILLGDLDTDVLASFLKSPSGPYLTLTIKDQIEGMTLFVIGVVNIHMLKMNVGVRVVLVYSVVIWIM